MMKDKEILSNSIIEHENWVESQGVLGRMLVMEDGDFRGLKLENRNLAGAQIPGSLFMRCDLRESVFSRSNLASSNLSGASAVGGQFVKTNLDYANLSGANFAGANFRRASLDSADLREADFSRADLRGIYFINSDITGAKFDDALIDEKLATLISLRR